MPTRCQSEVTNGGCSFSPIHIIVLMKLFHFHLGAHIKYLFGLSLQLGHFIFIVIAKSLILETLNFLMCADSSTNTKKKFWVNSLLSPVTNIQYSFVIEYSRVFCCKRNLDSTQAATAGGLVIDRVKVYFTQLFVGQLKKEPLGLEVFIPLK